VINKRYVAVSVLAAIFGYLVLWPSDESPEPTQDTRGAEPAREQQPQPREPDVSTRPEYGIAEELRAPPARPYYGAPPRRGMTGGYDAGGYGGGYDSYGYPAGGYESRGYAGRMESNGYGDRYGAGGVYGDATQPSQEGFRYRPLGEKEKERIRSQYPGPVPGPYYADPLRRQPPVTGTGPYDAQPAYPAWEREGYGFRRWDSAPDADSWRDPYRQRDQRRRPETIDPWASSPNPQWGSTPPAQRMYPSLTWEANRRLTYR
jgi:hypothetical protein